jgi:alcohol dehydrogenase class IV
MINKELSKLELKKKIQKKKVFLLSGSNLFKKNKKIINTLIENCIYTIHLKKEKIPKEKELKQIKKIFKKKKYEYIIAFGGGCVLDYAKIIYFSHNKKKKTTKLIAIPTTAGSGAESTDSAVIYKNNKKFSIQDKGILPTYYYLCSSTLKHCNQTTCSSAAFDVLAQSTESFFSPKSNKKSEYYSKKSIRLFLRNINNLKSKNMLRAANYSGKAICITKTGAPHALSYPFTSNFNIPHGNAVAINFLKILRYNANKKTKYTVQEKLKKLIKIFNVKSQKSLFDKINRIIKVNLKIETSYKNLGIKIENDLNKILKGINIERLENNPVKINVKDLKNILLTNNL